MTPSSFFTGVTGYVGGAFFDQWFNKGNVRNDFSISALARSADVAENSIRPLGVEYVIGSLDDSHLLIRECANADIKLSTLAIEQPHRILDLEILSPSLVGRVDTYVVAPPMIRGYGTGPVNQSTIRISLLVKASLKTGRR
ncbi:hypothetical protein BG006_002339 [Podila minutissima]|uniref:Uncharacterized protein n=1 Tax=Podila minutissima TaxID=64525 RepID=A0A9P5S9A7_9FUNG|nr:hypothetical protein BG006_002339 [Podila minutissima]